MQNTLSSPYGCSFKTKRGWDSFRSAVADCLLGASNPSVRAATIIKIRTYFASLTPSAGDIWKHKRRMCMQIMAWFLPETAAEFPGETPVIVLDRASWHTSKNLKKPPNVMLCHLPADSPELNPVERFWQEMHRVLKDRDFPTLKKAVKAAENFLLGCDSDFIQSLCAFPYIREIMAAFRGNSTNIHSRLYDD